jgi:hypothetical protein
MSIHFRRIFAVALACFWFTSASFAEHLSAEFPFCQPDHSPCCPQPFSSTPGSCPACQTPVAVAAKHESKSDSVRVTPRYEQIVYCSRRPVRIRVSPREIIAGLRYHPTVFQFKEDLRI